MVGPGVIQCGTQQCCLHRFGNEYMMKVPSYDPDILIKLRSYFPLQHHFYQKGYWMPLLIIKNSRWRFILRELKYI